YTYTPKQLRPKNLVLKGIYGGYDENDVKVALLAQNFEQATITKVTKITYNKQNDNSYFFIVQVTSNSLTVELTRIKQLLSQKIRWQRPRKRGPFQCHNCQRFGHTSQNCSSIQGGGTAIIIKRDLNSEKIHFPSSAANSILEFTLVKFQLKNNSKLYIISAYATNDNKRLFLDELNTLLDGIGATDPKNYYQDSINYKATIYPPAYPTFKQSNSYLDISIADSRINVSTIKNNKLKCLEYDSDHNAISMEISIEADSLDNLINETSQHRHRFKSTKWKKFTKDLEKLTVPRKTTVRYLGVHLDYTLKNKDHLDTQLKAASNAFKSNSRIFYSKYLSVKAKIICYQLLVRPILTYAAPIWWNSNPTTMEKLRAFERRCLRACTGLYRASKSNYQKFVSNEKLYEAADIPRIDNFIIKLVRDYFAKLPEINNEIINNLAKIKEDQI
ncbi:GSCOCG00012474001-RA-CDS, partial [Cotesia congregata]